MFIATSPQEKQEIATDKAIVKAILNLRKALRTNNAEIIATALHKYELPERTQNRFKYAIEWAILGEDQIPLWKQIKTIYQNQT